MTPITTFAGRTVAVFGLGRSGLAACRALLAGGATVVGGDDTARSREAAAAQGLQVEDLSAADWSRFGALVLAPGVPLTHPAPHWTVGNARAAGVEVIGDIELFCRQRAASAPASPFVAITGTNGKSTTTALIAHILRSAGRDTQLGGNIGTPILDLAPPAADRVHVVEMSSFQIALTPSLTPSLGVLLNVSPDHLDRHGTIEHYAALKARLLERAHRAVVGQDDRWSRDIAEGLRARGGAVERVSARGRVADGWYGDGTKLVAAAPWTGPLGAFADLAGLGALRGGHNMQNALAAAACALALGLSAGEVAAALKTFPGLPHRLEEIGRLGHTLFINDSKATNADSAATALNAFEGNVFWILGGRAKEGGIASLVPLFARIARAYLIGEASAEFAATLSGRLAFERCDTLAVALAQAAHDAAGAANAPEPVVLLSPACASYDQYPNFEVRGDHFRALVAALPGITVRRDGVA
jgi:UDP-N-acetylmuramoylalanine--D-glutamate ligase